MKNIVSNIIIKDVNVEKMQKYKLQLLSCPNNMYEYKHIMITIQISLGKSQNMTVKTNCSCFNYAKKRVQTFTVQES